MEEGRDSEIPREENDVKNAGSETTPKFEHLARIEKLPQTTTKEDFNYNCEAASGQPVEVQGLTGETFVLAGCHSIGSVMAKIAMMHSRFADHIVVLDPESGRKMAAEDHLLPVVRFVILNEDDVVVDIESTRLNLLLHVQHGDHIACARLVEALETFSQETFEPSVIWLDESLWGDVISRRDAGAVKTLMRAGVSAKTAFAEAASHEDADDVMFLLSVQPALIEDNSSGNTALLQAARYGRTDTVEKLLAAGSNIEHANWQGDTALLWAAVEGHTDTVNKFLAAGSNIEHANSQGDTALLQAAVQGHTDTVNKFLAAGSNIEHANREGNTALLQAAMHGCSDTVETLLAAGSNIEHANRKGNTALLLAANYGRTYTVETLLAAGSNIEHANLQGDTALLWAVDQGRTDTVNKLLAAGSNIEHVNLHGNTALFLAVDRGVIDTAKKLLAAGSNVRHANSDGDTALTFIVRNRPFSRYTFKRGSPHQEAEILAILLLEAQANVNHMNDSGSTALNLAVSGGFLGVVSALVSSGADVTDASAIDTLFEDALSRGVFY